MSTFRVLPIWRCRRWIRAGGQPVVALRPYERDARDLLPLPVLSASIPTRNLSVILQPVINGVPVDLTTKQASARIFSIGGEPHGCD